MHEAFGVDSLFDEFNPLESRSTRKIRQQDTLVRPNAMSDRKTAIELDDAVQKLVHQKPGVLQPLLLAEFGELAHTEMDVALSGLTEPTDGNAQQWRLSGSR